MKKVFLIIILLTAFILRFWQLGSYPAFNADEAAIGYNAYSLIQTGKDEHGNPWPIHFQSFNDYKPGLYVYVVMPFVSLFGLNEWSVRIPGAFVGVLTVLVVYFLVKKLSENNNDLKTKYDLLPLLAASLLAISPWHIHFSRGGWEVNAATFFITTGILFFIKGLKSLKFLILSALFFVLGFYTYHAARIVIPLLGLGLLLVYWRDLWKEKKNIFINASLSVFLLLPLIVDLFGPAGISRAAGVGLFADPGPLNRINELRGEHSNYQDVSAAVFHNKLANYGLSFFKNWLEHFEGEFLFLSGDIIERNRVPETGQTYIFFLFLFAIGIYKIVRSKDFKIILFWLIVAPVAAALTFQSPHALRAQNMVIPLEIINAFGLFTLIVWISRSFKSNFRIFIYIFLGLVILGSFLRYQHMYWLHMTKEYPFSSQYGVKELVSYLKTRETEFQKVLITDRYDQPYILFLFYMKYPPEQFQAEHQLTAKDQFGFSTVRNFSKYYFWPIDFEASKRDYPNSLIAGTDEEIPKESNIVKKVYGTNNYLYFEVVAN